MFPASQKIVVNNLTAKVTEQHLREIFENYGPIRYIDLLPDLKFGDMQRAFILFDTDCVPLVIKKMNLGHIDETPVTIKEVHPKPRENFRPGFREGRVSRNSRRSRSPQSFNSREFRPPRSFRGRSPSPRRFRRRSPSRSGSRSPRNRRFRSPSPPRGRVIPRRRDSRSRSPPRRRDSPSRSPPRYRNRSRSPRRPSRSRSPRFRSRRNSPRFRSISRSPRPFPRRSRSPPPGRSPISYRFGGNPNRRRPSPSFSPPPMNKRRRSISRSISPPARRRSSFSRSPSLPRSRR